MKWRQGKCFAYQPCTGREGPPRTVPAPLGAQLSPGLPVVLHIHIHSGSGQQPHFRDGQDLKHRVVRKFAQYGSAGSSTRLEDTGVIPFSFTAALRSNWFFIVLAHESRLPKCPGIL